MFWIGIGIISVVVIALAIAGLREHGKRGRAEESVIRFHRIGVGYRRGFEEMAEVMSGRERLIQEQMKIIEIGHSIVRRADEVLRDSGVGES